MKRFLIMLLAASTFMTAAPIGAVMPNVQAVTVQSQSIQGKQNIIKDSDWGYFTAEGGKGSINNDNGTITADVKSLGDVSYGMQVYNQGFPVYQGGKYVLTFDISSSVKRDVETMIQLDGGDYKSYTWKMVEATPQKQTVTVEFTMEDETDLVPKLCFNLGKEEGYEDIGEHKVTISNVGLYLVDDSDVNYNKEQKEEQKIVLNQLGYLKDSAKQVVFRGDVTDETFNVISQDTGKVVYTGQISGQKYNNSAKETDYYGDFSEVTTPGTYKITTDKLGESYEFKIGDDVYKNVFNDAQKFFYYQRCGENLAVQYAGKWAHPECHEGLAKIYGTDKYIDVSGGWHDAGDYGRYVVATSKSVADLTLAYNADKEAFSDNINIPESGNGIADILDELKGQYEWLFKMQNKDNGGAYHKVTCADFPGFVMPEDEKGQLIVCPVTTTATGDFAAVMAMGYETFKDSDKALAEKCLAAAEKAYDYLDKAPSEVVKNPDGIVTGEYGDSNDMDERYWAAAQLFKATGKSRYNEKMKQLVNQKVEMGYDWSTVGNYGNEAYLAAEGADEATKEKIKAAIIKEADRIVSASKADGYGVTNGSTYNWGSNMAILNDAVVLDVANSIAPKAEYVDTAREQINYCFGKNANAMSFVTGYGTASPKNPHHRPSVKIGEAIPGMIIGGVNSNLEDPYAKVYLVDAAPAKCYLDNDQSYSTNEVDIYWNSTLVHALAKTNMLKETGFGTTEKPDGPQNPDGPENPDGPQNPDGPEIPDTPVASDKLDVQVTTKIENGVRQVYTIKAKGEDINLSKASIRYYFSKSDNKAMIVSCFNTAANLKQAPWYLNLTNDTIGKIGSDEKGSYVEFKINKDLMLKNDGSSITMETNFANNDWSSMADYKGLGLSVIF